MIKSESQVPYLAQSPQIDRDEIFTSAIGQCLTQGQILGNSGLNSFISDQPEAEQCFRTYFDEDYYLSSTDKEEMPVVIVRESPTRLSEIWNLTHEFLNSVAIIGFDIRTCDSSQPEAWSSTFAASLPSNPNEITQQKLLLHALNLIQVLRPPAPQQVKPIFSVCKVLSTDISEEKLRNTVIHPPFSTKFPNKSLPKKRGRKPKLIVCFLCPHMCGYKLALIRHLKVAHQIERSQSLMYKRISEGLGRMRERYCS